MRAALIAATAITLFAACSTVSKVPTAPRTLLFPHGTYRHTVTITLLHGTMNGKPDGPRSQRFSGVMSLQEDKLTLLALSPFGSTVFRLTEIRSTKKVTLETEIEAIKNSESQIIKFLAPMRILFSRPKPLSDWPGNLELSTNPPARAQLADYDANRIARFARITTDEYDLTIKVDDYVP